MSIESDRADVIAILDALAREKDEPRAAPELLPRVSHQLRRLAARKRDGAVPDETLQPTSLVHEAYLRIVGDGERSRENPGHFYAAAAEAMRRILRCGALPESRDRGRRPRDSSRSPHRAGPAPSARCPVRC
jgi:hypothetical protein